MNCNEMKQKTKKQKLKECDNYDGAILLTDFP